MDKKTKSSKSMLSITDHTSSQIIAINSSEQALDIDYFALSAHIKGWESIPSSHWVMFSGCDCHWNNLAAAPEI